MYMYVASTMYSIPADSPLHVFSLPDYYFACHLAVFPLLIRAFSFLGGYDWSMLFVVAAASTLATIIFYYLVKDFKYSVNPFWASVVFIFFPCRWLLYHSVGASEPVFILLVVASLYCYKKDSYALAFLLAGLASATRIFGILLFVSYAATLIWQRKYRHLPLVLIIPACLAANFLIYQLVYGDFFAYFKYNGSFVSIAQVVLPYLSFSMPVPVPFPMFLTNVLRGNTNNLELFLALYILYLLGTLRLWKHKELFFYSAFFVGAILFIGHPDISRYLLPAAPFALILAFDDIISRKEFMLIFPVIIVLGYLYCWGLMPTNLMDAAMYQSMIQAMGR
jgi:Gpi18-like mannosyltransferase